MTTMAIFLWLAIGLGVGMANSEYDKGPLWPDVLLGLTIGPLFLAYGLGYSISKRLFAEERARRTTATKEPHS